MEVSLWVWPPKQSLSKWEMPLFAAYDSKVDLRLCEVVLMPSRSGNIDLSHAPASPELRARTVGKPDLSGAGIVGYPSR